MKKIISLALRLKTEMVLWHKIRGIYKNVRKQNDIWQPLAFEKQSHTKLWNAFAKRVNFDWLKVYGTISGVRSINYVPENIYYSEIEPRLNFKPYSKAITDKNHYHKFIDDSTLPRIVLRNINGVYYDSEYNYLSESSFNKLVSSFCDRKFVIKPTIDTGGGKGVRLFEFTKGNLILTPDLNSAKNLESLFEIYKPNFIVQEYIVQHEFFNRLNNTSVNTIRICTYRSYIDEQVHILHRILRVGKTGSVVDNQSAGGIALAICNNRKPGTFGVDKKGNKYYSINGFVFSNIEEIPFIDEICVIAKQISSKFLFSRFLGLDFCVDIEGKVLLIEVNDLSNEINFYQMTNGPLFGSFTEEIIRFCKQEQKSFMIDFSL